MRRAIVGLAALLLAAAAYAQVLGGGLLSPRAGGDYVAPLVLTIEETSTISTTNTVVLCDASAGAVAVNLASAAALQSIAVKKIDDGEHACTVTPDGSETIDGAAAAALETQYEVVRLVSDGENWFVL